MNALRTFFQKFQLTTPVAIIINAFIIALSILIAACIISGDVPNGGTPTAQKVRDYVAEATKQFKLQGSAWESCLASDETAKDVANEYNDGVQAEVTGTPTTYVVVQEGQGYGVVAKIEGAQDESYLRAAIDEALSGKAQTTPFKGSPIGASEFVEGTKNKVFLIEYADAECPFCIRFHPTLTSVLSDYEDKVGFVYRHFPLSQIHPNATRYALAIECAGKLQGASSYFGFMDYLLSAPLE